MPALLTVVFSLRQQKNCVPAEKPWGHSGVN